MFRRSINHSPPALKAYAGASASNRSPFTDSPDFTVHTNAVLLNKCCTKEVWKVCIKITCSSESVRDFTKLIVFLYVQQRLLYVMIKIFWPGA